MATNPVATNPVVTTIRLLGFYQDRSAARTRELAECLRRNLASPHIAEVHVFLEDGTNPAAHPVLADPKVRIIPHGKRLTFQDLFRYANRALAGQRVIIGNNDIYFDDTLARLDRYPLAGKLLCLSRWDVQRDGSAQFFCSAGSQDAWIFEAPLPEFPCAWYLGLPGCENRLAYEASEVGIELVNPSRTVRALHLHLSNVRNYVEKQRLKGSNRWVEPTWLGVPWLCSIVTCMGRLDDLRETLPSVAAEPRGSTVLVDYSCPDGAGAWAREHHPGVTVIAPRDRHWFNAAEARNLGAAAVDGDAVLCFLDADVAVAPGFADAILELFEPGAFLVPDRRGPGLDGVLVCGHEAFARAGGFDANYFGWAEASADLRAGLGRAGLIERCFPASLLAPRAGHSAEAKARFRPLPDVALAAETDDVYRKIKDGIAVEAGGRIPDVVLRELHRTFTHRKLEARGLVPHAPSATVAFQETMGYTIARLQAGASSHNNDRRPFEEIPPPLAGMAFTQVVASRVSPVRVEFRAPGKLYVLVGTDWDGYHPATAFLRERGFREALPCLRTRRGTEFEVWSLLGDAGEELELPTQVMLVARELHSSVSARVAPALPLPPRAPQRGFAGEIVRVG